MSLSSISNTNRDAVVPATGKTVTDPFSDLSVTAESGRQAIGRVQSIQGMMSRFGVSLAATTAMLLASCHSHDDGNVDMGGNGGTGITDVDGEEFVVAHDTLPPGLGLVQTNPHTVLSRNIVGIFAQKPEEVPDGEKVALSPAVLDFKVCLKDSQGKFTNDVTSAIYKGSLGNAFMIDVADFGTNVTEFRISGDAIIGDERYDFDRVFGVGPILGINEELLSAVPQAVRTRSDLVIQAAYQNAPTQFARGAATVLNNNGNPEGGLTSIVYENGKATFYVGSDDELLHVTLFQDKRLAGTFGPNDPGQTRDHSNSIFVTPVPNQANGQGTVAPTLDLNVLTNSVAGYRGKVIFSSDPDIATQASFHGVPVYLSRLDVNGNPVLISETTVDLANEDHFVFPIETGTSEDILQVELGTLPVNQIFGTSRATSGQQIIDI